MTNKALDYLKLLITLTNRQIIIVLLAFIVLGQSYFIHKLNEKIEQRDELIIDNDRRYNSNLNTLQDKINVQEKEKFKIIQDAQEYFRDRFEKLEDESHRNFREVKQIKNKT